MKFSKRCVIGAVAASCGLLSGSVTYAQVGSINSVFVQPRFFNDVPGSIDNVNVILGPGYHPSFISFDEQNVSAPTGYANRDLWHFSNNNGASAYAFANNDFFSVSMTLTLMGSPTSPRKEAGFILNTIGGDGQFIVDTDAHEVVAFGGPLPFYAFPATFNSGSTITLGMTYFMDPSGHRAIIYSANGINSPALEFSNLEQGIIDGSTLGGYLQVQNDPTTPSNSGMAIFQNINIAPVPEPTALALLGLGVVPLLLRRRRA
jgi:PEP-CTERM motif